MKIWKDIKKEFESQFLLVDYEDESLGGNYNDVKNFLEQTIKEILDEIADKEIEKITTLKLMLNYRKGYNQKRQEILDFKNKFFE